MKDERSGVRRVGDFLAGKGFYVILFVCIAVIGVSAWILLFTGKELTVPELDASVAGYGELEFNPDVFGDVLNPGEADDAFSSNGAVTPSPMTEPPKPVAKPTPTPTPTPSATPQTTAEAPQEAPNTEGGKQAKTLADITWAWPVAGSIERGFAVDGLLYNKTMASWRTHPGIDIAAAVGTKVLSIADGVVTELYDDDLMGTTVIIDHGCDMRSIYSNLAGTPVVVIGDRVTMGAVIGSVGDTATGEIGEAAHLHLEMTQGGDAVDPVGYLPTR